MALSKVTPGDTPIGRAATFDNSPDAELHDVPS
jgi:hypothetical protein